MLAIGMIIAVVLLSNIPLAIFVFLIADIGIDILDWLYILVIVFLLKKL